MKGKKLLAGLVSAAMVIGTMALPAFADDADNADAKPSAVNVSNYASLEDAVNAVAEGGTVNLEADETYSTYGTTYAQGRTLTFVGATDENGNPATTWNYGFDQSVAGEGGSDYSFDKGANITFKNVKMHDKVKNSNYRGFVRPNNLVFENCTFDSRLCYLGYESTTFKNCVFEDTGDWSLWCYTGNSYVFDGCEFYTSEKGAINLYREDNGTTATQDITIKDCTFTQTGDPIDKCAVQVSEDYLPLNNIYNINFSNVTVNGNYASNETFGKLLLNKNNKTGETLRVTVDGEQIFPTTVAKIGDNEYYNLEDAVKAANAGDTITLVNDAAILPKGEGKSLIPQITIDKSVTLDLAGHTIGYDKSVAKQNLTYTPAMFAIPAGVDVTITGNGTIDCEAGGNNAYGINMIGGSLTLEDGNFYGALTAVQVQKGSLNVKGGYFDLAASAKKAVPQYAKYVVNAIDANFLDGSAKVAVTGGTFVNFDPSKNPEGENTSYVPNGYFAQDNGDNTFSILPAKAKFINTAKTIGATVTLDNLHLNDSVNPEEDASYRTVIETASAEDTAKANTAIENNQADENESKLVLDISVVKTNSKGRQSKVNVTDQFVTYTLEEPIAADCTVKVYHVDSDGNVAEISDVKRNGQNITFKAPSFSTYAITYTADSLAEDAITKNIKVDFEEIAGTSSYNIVLKAADGKKINRFMSADLTFEMTLKNGAVGYTVTPAANVKLSDLNDGRYEFNMDGTNASGATGENITIGTVTFEGKGKVDFGVKTAETNIVNTALAKDNIVDYNTTGGDGTTTGKLDLSDKLTDVELKAPTKNLEINIDFNNKINKNAAPYQAMKVVISGGDLAADKVIELGEDNFDETKSSYNLKIENELTANTAYTVTVSGAGYRTTRYTVTMTGNKVLNFWNNVKDNAVNVEEGKDTSAKNVTFLAGDIVKDNTINIYDLSAVVSYFGTQIVTSAASDYAKYDLNRDGKIDSKDVAYVLVSWGK